MSKPEVKNVEHSDEGFLGEVLYIEVERLSKSLGNKIILKDLNFEVPKGHILGIVGPSESGKTSLIKVLAGISKFDEGALYFQGQALGPDSKKKISTLIPTGYLEPVWTGLDIKRFYSLVFDDFNEDVFNSFMSEYKLEEDKKLSEYSQGEKELLCVILAFSREADLYLLDEPFATVDPLVKDQVYQMFLEAVSKRATIILSTNDLSEVERFLDLVLFLKDGALERFGSAEMLRYEEKMSLADLYRKLYVSEDEEWN